MTKENGIGLMLIAAGTGIAILFPMFAIVGIIVGTNGMLSYIFPGPTIRRMTALTAEGQNQLKHNAAQRASTPITWYLSPAFWLFGITVIVVCTSLLL